MSGKTSAFGYQFREFARFNPDGPDMRVAGPAEPAQTCEGCTQEIAWDDVLHGEGGRVLCGACWVEESDRIAEEDAEDD